MDPLSALKTYANLIIGVVVVVLMAATGIYIHVLKGHLDSARATVQSQALTIQGYALASQAAQASIAAHVQEATAQGQQVASVVASLQTTVPKTDEEARQWALKAAEVIR